MEKGTWWGLWASSMETTNLCLDIKAGRGKYLPGHGIHDSQHAFVLVLVGSAVSQGDARTLALQGGPTEGGESVGALTEAFHTGGLKGAVR